MEIFYLLTGVLMVLKLTGQTTVPWWVVVTPAAIGTIIILVGLLIFAISQQEYARVHLYSTLSL